eukprot:6588532-Pyramimonas_sp.AAC.1
MAWGTSHFTVSRPCWSRRAGEGEGTVPLQGWGTHAAESVEGEGKAARKHAEKKAFKSFCPLSPGLPR